MDSPFKYCDCVSVPCWFLMAPVLVQKWEEWVSDYVFLRTRHTKYRQGLGFTNKVFEDSWWSSTHVFMLRSSWIVCLGSCFPSIMSFPSFSADMIQTSLQGLRSSSCPGVTSSREQLSWNVSYVAKSQGYQVCTRLVGKTKYRYHAQNCV